MGQHRLPGGDRRAGPRGWRSDRLRRPFVAFDQDVPAALVEEARPKGRVGVGDGRQRPPPHAARAACPAVVACTEYRFFPIRFMRWGRGRPPSASSLTRSQRPLRRPEPARPPGAPARQSHPIVQLLSCGSGTRRSPTGHNWRPARAWCTRCGRRSEIRSERQVGRRRHSSRVSWAAMRRPPELARSSNREVLAVFDPFQRSSASTIARPAAASTRTMSPTAMSLSSQKPT